MVSSTERFSDRVANYVQARPTYPAAVYAFLKENARLTKSSVVADIGSGTGLSTKPLLELVSTVYAVEPNEAMRKAAEAALKTFEGFKSIDGTAENTHLANASVELVLAAQAFHWFEPVATSKEWKRILKPNSPVALLWNEREETGSELLFS